MAGKKEPLILQKQIGVKRLRSRVRLEAAIRADIALNDLIPKYEKEYDRRVAAGEPFELTSYDEWAVAQLGPPNAAGL